MNYEHLFWSAVLDALNIYLIGFVIGTIFAFFRWGNSKKLGFFEVWVPAVIWPLAVIKEAIKYLRK